MIVFYHFIEKEEHNIYILVTERAHNFVMIAAPVVWVAVDIYAILYLGSIFTYTYKYEQVHIVV